MISAKFVPLKYYTLSSQLRRLTSFSVGLFGSANSLTRSYPVMRKSCIGLHMKILNFSGQFETYWATFGMLSYYQSIQN